MADEFDLDEEEGSGKKKLPKGSKKGGAKADSDRRKLDSFDENMDIDFDIPDINEKDDRNPVMRVGQGVYDELVSVENAAKFVKKTAYESLPKDYKENLSKVKAGKDRANEVYDETLKAAGPGIKSLKRAGKKLIPSVEKILPKSVVEKLKDLTAEEDNSQYNAEEAEIASTLANIFDAQQVAQEQLVKESDAKEEARQEVSKKQFAATIDSNNAVARGIGRLVSYQDNVLSKFQRKSLELQHRHYFVAKEMLEHSKATNQVILQNLTDITKNTGLPDVAKALKSEEFLKEYRERMYGKVQDSIGDVFRKMPDLMVKSAVKYGKQKAEEFNELASMADTMVDQLSSGDIDAAKMAGGIMGSSMTDMFMKRIANSEFAKELRKNENVIKTGSMFSVITDNFIPFVLDQAAKGTDFGDGNPVQKLLYKVFEDALTAKDRAKRVTITKNLHKEQHSPAIWDILSRRTLIEIIPGYLAKILKENQMHNQFIMNGHYNDVASTVDEITYSTRREGFVSTKVADADIMKIFEKEIVSTTSQQGLADIRYSLFEGDKEKKALTTVADKYKVSGKDLEQEIMLMIATDAAQGTSIHPLRYMTLTAQDTPRFEAIKAYFGKQFPSILKYIETNKDVSKFELVSGMIDIYKDMSPDEATRLKWFTSLGKAQIEKGGNVSKAFFGTDIATMRRLGFVSDKDINEGLDRDSFSLNLHDNRQNTKATQITKDFFQQNLNAGMGMKGRSLKEIKEQEKLDRKAEEEARDRALNPKKYEVKGKADGGKVTQNERTNFNPKDTVPAMLQEGEYIIPKATVDKYGTSFFDSLIGKHGKNRKNNFEATIKGFAKGGRAGRRGGKGDIAEQQLEVLQKILTAVSSSNVIVGPDGQVSYMGYFGGFGQDVRKLGKAGIDLASSTVKKANQLRKDVQDFAINKVFKPTWNFATDMGGKLFESGKKKLGEAKDMMTDLFLEGQNQVALTYKKLKEGGYHYLNDKGEKVILTSWADIKGALYDIYDSETGMVIVSKEKIHELYSKGKGKIMSILSWVKDKSLWALDKTLHMANLGLMAGKAIMEAGTAVAKGLWGRIKAPVDVYVKGKIDQGPRLRRILFINGAYFNKEGKIIDHQDNIDGPVYTKGAENDATMVLSMEDIKEGIVERDGTPISGGGPLGRLLNKGLHYGKKALDYGIAAAKFGIGVVGGALGHIGAWAKKGMGKIPGLNINLGIECRLDRILRHLQYAFPVEALYDDLVTDIGAPVESATGGGGGSMVKKFKKMKIGALRKLMGGKKKAMDWYDEHGVAIGNRTIDSVTTWYDKNCKPVKDSVIARAKMKYEGMKNAKPRERIRSIIARIKTDGIKKSMGNLFDRMKFNLDANEKLKAIKQLIKLSKEPIDAAREIEIRDRMAAVNYTGSYDMDILKAMNAAMKIGKQSDAEIARLMESASNSKIRKMYKGVGAGARNLINKFKKKPDGTPKVSLWSKIKGMIPKGKEKEVKQLSRTKQFRNAINNIPANMMEMVAGVGMLGTVMSKVASDKFDDATGGILGKAKAAIEEKKKKIQDAIDEKKKKAKEYMDMKKSKLRNYLDSKKAGAQSKWQEYKEKGSDTLDSWQEQVRARKEAASAKMGKMKAGANDKMAEAFKGMSKMMEGFGKFGGMLSNIVGMVTKMIPGLGRFVAMAGGLATGAAALGGIAKAAIGNAASGAAGFVAKHVTWQAAGRLAMGTLRVATGPIGLAITAVGLLAWQGYKYYKRRRNLEPLMKLRFLQYGLPVCGTEMDAKSAIDLVMRPISNIFNKEDARVAVHYLEEELEDNIEMKDNGGYDMPAWADIWNDFCDDFDCDKDNAQHEASFKRWFFKRFLPVYTRHRRAATEYGDCDLQDADAKVPPEKKADYVKRTEFTAPDKISLGVDPYAVLSSPWPNTVLYGNKEYIKMLGEGIKASSALGKNLEPGVTAKIDAQQKQNMSGEPKSKGSMDTGLTGFLKNEMKATAGLDDSESSTNKRIKQIMEKHYNNADALDKGYGGAETASLSTSFGGFMKEALGLGKASADEYKVKDPTAMGHYLAKVAKQNGLKDEELAVFLANMDHETGGFKHLSENLKYKAMGLFKTFGKARVGSYANCEAAVAGGEEAIAELIYGGSWGAANLGNIHAGDGYKFKGRGFTHLTGRDNYYAAGKDLGIDLINNPELASQPDVAAQIALWFWTKKGIRKKLAKASSLQEKILIARKAINGGTNGLAETQKLTTSYLGFVPDDAQAGSVGGGGGASPATPPNAPVKTAAPAAAKPVAGTPEVSSANATPSGPAPSTGGGGGALAPVVNVEPTDMKPVTGAIGESGANTVDRLDKQLDQGKELIKVVQESNANNANLIQYLLDTGKISKADAAARLHQQQQPTQPPVGVSRG